MSRAWPRPGYTALVFAALAALALAAGDAWARGGSGGGRGGGGKSGHSSGKSGSHHGGSKHHHGHSHSGSGVFYGSYWGGYWSSSAYWMGLAYLPAATVYYIEKSEDELQTESAWFYCENDAAYYPYVRSCPTGWVKVAPFAVMQ